MSYLYRICRRSAWAVAWIFAIATAGCSGNDPLDDILTPHHDNPSFQIPSDTIHIHSLADLETLTATDLIGNEGEGMEITSLTYTCTDTLGLNTLVFDLEATICSGDRERTISRTAEWTVELVAVEYQPFTQIYFLWGSYWLQYAVLRLRYYSDGSCIGPDIFMPPFDNPTGASIGRGGSEPAYYPGLISVEESGDVVDISEDPTREMGSTLYITYTYNNNCRIIGSDGREITPYELYYMPTISDMTELFGGNWGKKYLETILLQNTNSFSLDGEIDYESDPELKALNEQCKNVPLKEPVSYIRESAKSIDGWYWYPNAQEYRALGGIYSYCPFHTVPYGGNPPYEFYEQFFFYCKLLEIDGRSINFADLMNTKYHNLTTSVTKTSTGYLYTLKNAVEIFDRRMNYSMNYELKFVNGPTETVDYTHLGYLDKIEEYLKDGETPPNNMKSQLGTETAITIPANIEKPRIDMRLPDSFTKNTATHGKIR